VDARPPTETDWFFAYERPSKRAPPRLMQGGRHVLLQAPPPQATIRPDPDDRAGSGPAYGEVPRPRSPLARPPRAGPARLRRVNFKFFNVEGRRGEATLVTMGRVDHGIPEGMLNRDPSFFGFPTPKNRRQVTFVSGIGCFVRCVGFLFEFGGSRPQALAARPARYLPQSFLFRFKHVARGTRFAGAMEQNFRSRQGAHLRSARDMNGSAPTGYPMGIGDYSDVGFDAHEGGEHKQWRAGRNLTDPYGTRATGGLDGGPGPGLPGRNQPRPPDQPRKGGFL